MLAAEVSELGAHRIADVEFDQAVDYHHELAARADEVRFLEIPSRLYLMIEGSARPGEQGFADAIAALYPVAHTLHFALKQRGVEAPVGALEGLYWVDEPGPITVEEFEDLTGSRARWSWRLLLPVPAPASKRDVAAAIAEVRAKKRPALLDGVRCEAWEEGRVAQVMHVGPYDAEAPTVERLHHAIEARGLHRRGCHHEIYISDPRRTKPERMKTLIRQPVAPA